jgi:hypothetical protein
MKKVFRFHAKRGQADMVIGILNQYGTPTTEQTAEGVKVFVELPEGVSKRSIDRTLRDAGVPGAASCRNTPLIRMKREVFLEPHLERLYVAGHREVKVKWFDGGMTKHSIACEPYCDGPGVGYYLD